MRRIFLCVGLLIETDGPGWKQEHPLILKDSDRERSSFTIAIIGNTLFAEGIADLIAEMNAFRVLGCWSTFTAVESLLSNRAPSLIIFDGTNQEARRQCQSLIFNYPNLSFICIDLSQHSLQVISSFQVGAQEKSFIGAIQSLQQNFYRQWG